MRLACPASTRCPQASRFFFQPRAANVSAEPPRSVRKQDLASAWRWTAGSRRWRSARPASWGAGDWASPSAASGPAPPRPRSSGRPRAARRPAGAVAELKLCPAALQTASQHAGPFFLLPLRVPSPQLVPLHNPTALCPPKPEFRSSFSSLSKKCQSEGYWWTFADVLYFSGPCLFFFFLIWKLEC